LISVLIPFHNRIAWMLEAVESVKKQTVQDIEIILVDDGSTEAVIVPGVRYIRQDHGGAARARNLGVSAATGEWIAFLDSDDLFMPGKLERQLAFMQVCGFDLSHTSYQRMDESGNPGEVRDSGRLSGNLFPGILTCCPIATPTVMGRTEIFKAHPFPNLSIGEDVCLWISLAAKYAFGGMDEALSLVRVGPESAAVNRKKSTKGLMNIASFILREFPDHKAQAAKLMAAAR